MAESENLLLDEPSANTGGEHSRRIHIRFNSPAARFPEAVQDGDQCWMWIPWTLDACKSSKQKQNSDGIQTSSDAQLVPTGFGKQKQFSADTLCRLMRCDTVSEGWKRSQRSLGLSSSNNFKRSKRSLSIERKPLSIDDLPDVVLAEILSRLPCNKLVFQCKSVSKRWCTLISDPYFIGRFVHIRSIKGTPKIRALINRSGEDFPPKMPWSPKLDLLLERIMVVELFLCPPVVVGTYNDLVLCCATKYYQRDYFVCNVYTNQWVALPPVPVSSECHKIVRVGFISDIPDYNCEEDNCEEQSIQFQFDANCSRWRVVRILPPDQLLIGGDSFKLKLEIFFSETGEWRELVVSSPPPPRPFRFDWLDNFSFAYNGMLYWAEDELLFVGLGPFKFNNNKKSSKGSNGSSFGDKLHLTVFQVPQAQTNGFAVRYTGLGKGGCVRMCFFCKISRKLYVWELKKEVDDLMGEGAGVGKLCLSKRMVYILDPNMYSGTPRSCSVRSFDPYDKDIMYLYVQKQIIIKCNIRTREWSEIAEKRPRGGTYYFPVVLPWWPTPVPVSIGPDRVRPSQIVWTWNGPVRV